MPKANRICHCCGREYYYCPSCPDDRRDPSIYVMWDSKLCKEIFNVLTNEFTGSITTLDCKRKLIELGVNNETVFKDSVKKHIDRVMSYEEEIIVDDSKKIENTQLVLEETEQLEEKIEIKTEIVVEDILTETDVDNISKVKRTKKSSLKNKENSEVD